MDQALPIIGTAPPAPPAIADLPRDTSWATRVETDAGPVIVVDPARAYPLYFRLLGEPPVTQESLEIARACFTEDLALVFGLPLHLKILKDDNYRLARFPRGAGPEAGQARFRVHYNKLIAARRVAAV